MRVLQTATLAALLVSGFAAAQEPAALPGSDQCSICHEDGALVGAW